MLSLNCRNGGKKGAAVSYHDETEIGINGGEKGVAVSYLKSPIQGINVRKGGATVQIAEVGVRERMQ